MIRPRVPETDSDIHDTLQTELEGSHAGLGIAIASEEAIEHRHESDDMDATSGALTDPDSRIMPAPGGDFKQSYNAQAAVDTDTMLVVARGLTRQAADHADDGDAGCLARGTGRDQRTLADAGYFSEANVAACVKADNRRM